MQIVQISKNAAKFAYSRYRSCRNSRERTVYSLRGEGSEPPSFKASSLTMKDEWRNPRKFDELFLQTSALLPDI